MQHRGFMQIAGGRKFPGPWIAPNWTRDPATGLWTCTPVVGAELLLNGDFANWTGDNPDNWTLYPPENATNYVTQDGGCRIVWDDYFSLRQSVLTINQWYSTTTDIAVNTGGGGRLTLLGNQTPLNYIYTGVQTATGRCAGDTVFYCWPNGLLGGDITVRSLSAKQLTFSSLVAIRNMGRSTLAFWGAPVVVSTGYHAGVVGWATPDYLNGIYARHNRTNVVLEKCVNGTYTVLVDAAAAYSDSLLPTVFREDRTHYHVKYNGVQVGATIEITDALVVDNTYFGLFSTGGGTVGDPVYA